MNREKILKAYLKGWDDELNGDKLILPVNELERKACILGSIDALVGDELSSVDNKTDDDIIARTIKSVKNENLSELINVVYNSEDQIDGEYNSKNELVSEFSNINQKYERLLVDMNTLVELINKELKK